MLNVIITRWMDDKWEYIGIGILCINNDYDYHNIIVTITSEDTGELLLTHRILPCTICEYDLSCKTFIIWIDTDIYFRISFQYENECEEVYNKITLH